MQLVPILGQMFLAASSKIFPRIAAIAEARLMLFSGQSPAPRSQSHRSLTGASSRPRALQSRTHRGMDELRDIAAQARDLAYQSGRDEVELLGRRHEDVVDPIRQVPAHRRELELELEIGDGAQTSHDDRQ